MFYPTKRKNWFTPITDQYFSVSGKKATREVLSCLTEQISKKPNWFLQGEEFPKARHFFCLWNRKSIQGSIKFLSWPNNSYLFLLCVYESVNAFILPLSLAPLTHSPQSAASATEAVDPGKTPGKVSHRVAAADRMWGYDGQRRNMRWHWELNPSYRWQVHVSAGDDDRWHLTLLNSTSADIPLAAAAARPIRIDCDTATLLCDQVTAAGCSFLIMMMLHIDPSTTACCVKVGFENHCLVLSLITQRPHSMQNAWL